MLDATSDRIYGRKYNSTPDGSGFSESWLLCCCWQLVWLFPSFSFSIALFATFFLLDFSSCLLFFFFFFLLCFRHTRHTRTREISLVWLWLWLWLWLYIYIYIYVCYLVHTRNNNVTTTLTTYGPKTVQLGCSQANICWLCHSMWAQLSGWMVVAKQQSCCQNVPSIFPLALSEFPSLFLDFSMDTSRQVGRSVGAYTMCLV